MYGKLRLRFLVGFSWFLSFFSSVVFLVFGFVFIHFRSLDFWLLFVIFAIPVFVGLVLIPYGCSFMFTFYFVFILDSFCMFLT